jgi:hypothetical protein
MSKKKKSASSVGPKLYKKMLLGLAAMGAILGAYCFYVSKTAQPPVFEGMGYPIKTPGPGSDKKRLEVYNHLVEKSKTTGAVRLLPPHEIPDFAAATEPSTRPSPDKPLATEASPSPAEGKKPPVSSSSVIPERTAPSPAGVTQAIDRLVGSAALKKGPSSQEAPVKGGTLMPTGSGSVRLQVGGVYGSLEKVNRTLSFLKKRVPWPAGVTHHIQSAKVKDKLIYRLLFVGFKTQKEVLGCQNVLNKGGISSVTLIAP